MSIEVILNYGLVILVGMLAWLLKSIYNDMKNGLCEIVKRVTDIEVNLGKHDIRIETLEEKTEIRKYGNQNA